MTFLGLLSIMAFQSFLNNQFTEIRNIFLTLPPSDEKVALLVKGAEALFSDAATVCLIKKKRRY